MAEVTDQLTVFEAMAGRWRGVSGGRFGRANVEKAGEFVLAGRFFQMTSRSVSSEETHEDIGLFSFDEAEQTLMLREFHNEGYVNTYRRIRSDPGLLVFETIHIENSFAPTLRARISIATGDQLVETLSLATEDGPFEECVRAVLDRV